MRGFCYKNERPGCVQQPRGEALIKRVATALAVSDITAAGRANLSDESFLALESLCDRLHKRVTRGIGTPGSQVGWMDSELGDGAWGEFCVVANYIVCLERAARTEMAFSTWPIHAAKYAEEEGWEEYRAYARIAIDEVFKYYGERSIAGASSSRAMKEVAK